MQTDYKPTLRFDLVEKKRINAAAESAGLKPGEWMRKLILDNSPLLTTHNPLKVRVDGFDEQCGWNLIHFADALEYAQTVKEFGDTQEIAHYMDSFTTTRGGEVWIDGEKLPGVPANDVTSIRARAVDLCRAVNLAHIRAELAG
ncbi:hypothetical protein SB764_00630 [Paraburkholderia sp. SIMBA_027]